MRLTSETIDGASVAYTHDAAGQLTGASGARVETYAYDANGNRAAETGYTTEVGNRVTASPGFTYTHDDEGNLVSKTETATAEVTTYAYDHRDRLVGVTIVDAGGATRARVDYGYDALDRRDRVVSDPDGDGPNPPVTTRATHDGLAPYADHGASDTVRHLRGPAIDELLARVDRDGPPTWYLTDLRGSVRAVANAAGLVTGARDYDSFGGVRSESGGGLDRFGYTGREYDAVARLQYNQARYYDAAIGRWTQEDPIGFGGRDPNLYRYVGNQPTGFTDPSGLQSAPTRTQLSTYIHLLMNYYQRIMQQMMLVGEDLYTGGIKKLGETSPWFGGQFSFPSLNTSCGGSGDLFAQATPTSVKRPFPTNWPALMKAIQYSMSNYDKMDGWNVGFAMGSSYNLPFLPGIAISSEAFYGDEFGAISDLIHEPQHNFGGGFCGTGFGHGAMKNIVPTVATDPHGSDAFTQLVDFLKNAKRNDGKSLWQLMLKEAGPRPVRPW